MTTCKRGLRSLVLGLALGCIHSSCKPVDEIDTKKVVSGQESTASTAGEYADLPAAIWTQEKVGATIRIGMSRTELEKTFGRPYSDREYLGYRKCEWFLDNYEAPSSSIDGQFAGFYVLLKDGAVTQWEGKYVYNQP